MRRIYFILIAFIISSNSALHAAELSTAPILRIEAGGHNAPIRRIAVDAGGHFAASVSDDKTARLYEVSTGRLIRIFRPPVADGNEGQLNAVALSPDGSILAVGGYTGWDWDTKASIYLFETSSGRLVRRIGGLPRVIFHLAFSTDGKMLAVSLGGSGIRILRSSDGSEIGRDTAYAEASYSVQFALDGRVVSSCEDGYIRLYERPNGKTPLKLIARIKPPGGNRPFAARFSPDGSKIAVGYADSSNVDILNSVNLSRLYRADTGGVNGNLANVAWSGDGHALYAGGHYKKTSAAADSFPVRRWRNDGRGAGEDLQTGIANTIMELAPLPGGDLLAGSQDPAIALLGQNSRKRFLAQSPNADFRDIGEGFLINRSGSEVSFGYEAYGKAPHRFDATARTLTQGRATGAESPITRISGISIEGWKDTFEPRLNGLPLKLNQRELSRSLAIAPDGSRFLLGGSWFLRCFSSSGAPLWKTAAPGAVWGVNIAANGRLAVAGYGDGTIRWHRLSDGKELLAFFPHADRKRWVLWTPSGFYDASPGGEELIGWHVNTARDQASDFFPAARFRSAKYRPDLISKILETLDEEEALRLANTETGRKQFTATSPLELLPPVVAISTPADGATVSTRTVTIRYSVRTPAEAPVTGIRVLVDGRPVSVERGLKVVQKNSAEQTLSVDIPERECEVSIIAENSHSASVPATVRLTWGGKKPEEFTAQPKLYALAVGVSSYKDTALTLRYAAKDAQDFAESLQKQRGGLYRDVTVKMLTDAKATRDDVMDGLDWLQKEVTARDVGVIFIAGHGVNDPAGIYYYLPQNVDTDKLKRTGVAFSDIRNTLSSLAGKAMLFVDTCHSGNVMGTRRGVADINAVVNELASSENGVVVFASSTGKQYSLEDDKWGNGAFTKALVEGISGKADYTGSGRITINMLDLYLSERVKELTGGRQTPTTTKPHTVADFPFVIKR